MSSSKTSRKPKKTHSSPKESKTKSKVKTPDPDKFAFAEITGFTGSKIFDCLLLYGIENCDRLRSFSKNDTFPVDAYYDLEGKMKHHSGDGKDKRKTPFNTGRHGKAIVQYLCSRFVWEIKQIDSRDYNPKDISGWILNGVKSLEFNISQLIMHTAEMIPIDNLITKSHGLEIEIMSKIGNDVFPIDVSFYIAKTLTQFIKILAFNFSNEFWYNNAKTIGERNFRAVLASMEANLPLGSKTLSHGSMSEIEDFLADMIPEQKKNSNEDSKNEESEDSDVSSSSRNSKKKKKKKSRRPPSDEEHSEPESHDETPEYEHEDE